MTNLGLQKNKQPKKRLYRMVDFLNSTSSSIKPATGN